jgi:RNA polymerase sigma-70 factor (ECF subfamily)
MQSPPRAVERDQRPDLASGRTSSPKMMNALQSVPSLYRCAYRLLGNKADAEDAVQDALLAAHKHLHQFRGDAQISTWLMTIVINCARMQLRKRSRHKQLSLDSRFDEEQDHPLSETLADGRPNPEDECHRSMLHRRLLKSAAELSPVLRKTFQLRFGDRLSILETARILGVPTGTVKAQTARARAKLRKAICGVLQPRSRPCASQR